MDLRRPAKRVCRTSEELEVKEVSLSPGVESSVARVRVVLASGSEEV